MARFGTLLALLATFTVVSAFSPHPAHIRSKGLSALANEDTDFDAPILKNPAKATALDHDIVVVDDECYMGKYGQYPDCVDFDPMHNVDTNTKAKSEMPDFSDIMEAIKNSPIGKLFAQN